MMPTPITSWSAANPLDNLLPLSSCCEELYDWNSYSLILGILDILNWLGTLSAFTLVWLFLNRWRVCFSLWNSMDFVDSDWFFKFVKRSRPSTIILRELRYFALWFCASLFSIAMYLSSGLMGWFSKSCVSECSNSFFLNNEAVCVDTFFGLFSEEPS